MSAQTEFESLKQQIVEVVTKDPTIRYTLIGWVTDEFVPKSDYSKILDEIKELRQETKALRKDMRQGFAASDRRFEAMDKRFAEMRQDMDQRFEAADQRLETMQGSIDQVNLTVGGLQVRAGENLERTVASVLRFGLNKPDIKPESLKLRQKIIDQEGLISKQGKQYEYDLLPHNGEHFVIEIRSGGGAKRGDIEWLCDKAELIQHQLKLPSVKAVFITLRKTGELIKACEELAVILIA